MRPMNHFTGKIQRRSKVSQSKMHVLRIRFLHSYALWVAARVCIRIEVDSHQQVQGNAKPSVRQGFHANDFPYIFAAHRIMRRRKWKGNKHPHSLVIIGTPGVEVDALLRGVNTDGHVFEMLIARFGWPDTERLRDFRASTAPFVRELFRRLSHGLP